MKWIVCRAVEGGEVWVNLEDAMSMRWNEHDKRTSISFPGGEADFVAVQESPNEILEKARLARN
jgi:hypothetical protein